MSNGFAEQFSDLSSSRFLRLRAQHIRQELENLAVELRLVQEEIAALRATVCGYSAIYGPEAIGLETQETIRMSRMKRRGGLAAACRSVLQDSLGPCSVSEICVQVNALDPELLVHHRNPMASVMSILRSFAQRGQAVRGIERGRSVWQWGDTPIESANPSSTSTAPECYQ